MQNGQVTYGPTESWTAGELVKSRNTCSQLTRGLIAGRHGCVCAVDADDIEGN